MIAIVDYGMGNLGSIRNMLRRIGHESVVTSDHREIERAGKLILPGVGAFDAAVSRLRERELDQVLEHRALRAGVPLLGICLGMQLLTEGSEEGKLPGLSWIPGRTFRFRPGPGDPLRVPHMGWNVVRTQGPSSLTESFGTEMRFYFVHSYFVRVTHPQHSILKTRYGVEFDSGIQRGNLFGVQFHPEKSHRFGMQVLSNFAALAS